MVSNFNLVNNRATGKLSELLDSPFDQCICTYLNQEASDRSSLGLDVSSKTPLFELITPMLVVNGKEKAVKNSSFLYYRNTRTGTIHRVPNGIWYNQLKEHRMSYYNFMLDRAKEYLKEVAEQVDKCLSDIRMYPDEIYEKAVYMKSSRLWPTSITSKNATIYAHFKQLDSLMYTLSERSRQIAQLEACIVKLETETEFI